MTSYSNRGYSVAINNDGSIIVKGGDTVGGYSIAIYGNLEHMNEFARKKNGTLVPVENINLIRAGETLWHVPSVPSAPQSGLLGQPPLEVPIPIKPDGKPDIDRILQKYRLPRNFYEPLRCPIISTSDPLFYGGTALHVASRLAIFLDLILKEKTVATWAYFAGTTTFAVTAVVASTLASLWQFLNAYTSERQRIAFRGVAYGVTAFAYAEKPPVLPRAIEENITSFWHPDSVQEAKRMWDDGVRRAMNGMKDYCTANGMKEDDVRFALRCFAEYHRYSDTKTQKAVLAAKLLLDLANHQNRQRGDRSAFLQPWSWYPDDRNDQRPNYPAELSDLMGYGWDNQTPVWGIDPRQ